MNNLTIPLISASALLAASCCSDTDQETQKPNIIVILADDFGVGDIQSHYPDNKIPTPHLDKLVSEGMSFTDAHSSSAVSSPTRYGLFTGRYNWRTPLQEWVLGPYEPPLIKQERTTLPEALKEQGYATACIGKWHLGWYWPGEQSSERLNKNKFKKMYKEYTWDYTKPIKGGPTEHGFDYYFGTHVPNFPPFTYIENDSIVIQPTAYYNPAEHEGEFVPSQYDSCPQAPGWDFSNILPEITRRSVNYIHEQSKKEEPFFLYFAMTSPHEPVSPSERFAGKSGIAPIADFVMETDWSAGQVIKAVEEAGIAENTLIIFTADNGHSHYTGWEKLIEAGHKPSGEFRGHKADIWEGGHRVPLIVKWKGKVAAGSSNEQIVCLNDIFATCYDLLTGKKLPHDVGEDSFSFLDVLLGKSDNSERKNIVHHSVKGEFAYRNGPWKIVFKTPTDRSRWSDRGKPAVMQLYNLEEDIAETRECSKEHPEIARRLEKELQEVIERGTSRPGEPQQNDVRVVYDTIQKQRWAEEN